MRKRVKRILKMALSATPIVRRRLSPFLLRRVTSFQTHCENVKVFPERICHKGFYLPIHESTIERRALPFCLEHKDRAAFWSQVGTHLEAHVPPAFLAGLRNATVLAGGIAVRSRDNFLFYEPFHDQNHVPQGSLLHPLLPPLDLHLQGDYIHLGLLWGWSHYHWVLDVLPRLSIVDRFDRLRDMPLILPGLTPPQRESLQILGIRPERIAEFHGNHWHVENLYYPSTLGFTGNPTSLAVQWLRERFASFSQARKRLYVSRTDARERRVINEADLLKEIVAFGFEVVCPSGMPFADQVRLFSQAQIILGPHGGGLANSVFAPPGATVIEVFPPNYINGCFWALANVCAHKYGFSLGMQRGQDVEVNIDKVLRLLTSVMDSQA
jgi:Glycosyltransferase 61